MCELLNRATSGTILTIGTSQLLSRIAKQYFYEHRVKRFVPLCTFAAEGF